MQAPVQSPCTKCWCKALIQSLHMKHSCKALLQNPRAKALRKALVQNPHAKLPNSTVGRGEGALSKELYQCTHGDAECDEGTTELCTKGSAPLKDLL